MMRMGRRLPFGERLFLYNLGYDVRGKNEELGIMKDRDGINRNVSTIFKKKSLLLLWKHPKY